MNALVPFRGDHAVGKRVTKAAAELRVTHGAVSRQLQSLERAIGADLFREGRLLVPTKKAQQLHRDVADALGLLSTAVRHARPQTERGPMPHGQGPCGAVS